jgi:hypothetical protein
MSELPYNPLDKKNLATSVADALLEKPVGPLPPEEFEGAGVYAIYYVGDFPPYQKISYKNRDNKFELPIYVGKAVPAGARKGGFGLDAPPGKVLFKRLYEHTESIKQTQNLDIADFYCRYLVVDDIWIPLGESLLIENFSPIWNKLIDGFGNHDPGKGRYNQQKSRWDLIHPGRFWAYKCQNRTESADDIIKDIREYLNSISLKLPEC